MSEHLLDGSYSARPDVPRPAAYGFPQEHGNGYGHGRAAAGRPNSCVSCQIRQGIPVCSGCPTSYYLFQEDGRRLLVLTRGTQQRIRINGAVEVVVLDVQGDRVQLGIVGVSGSAKGSNGSGCVPKVVCGGDPRRQ